MNSLSPITALIIHIVINNTLELISLRMFQCNNVHLHLVDIRV